MYKLANGQVPGFLFWDRQTEPSELAPRSWSRCCHSKSGGKEALRKESRHVRICRRPALEAFGQGQQTRCGRQPSDVSRKKQPKHQGLLLFSPGFWWLKHHCWGFCSEFPLGGVMFVRGIEGYSSKVYMLGACSPEVGNHYSQNVAPNKTQL